MKEIQNLKLFFIKKRQNDSKSLLKKKKYFWQNSPMVKEHQFYKKTFDTKFIILQAFFGMNFNPLLQLSDFKLA